MDGKTMRWDVEPTSAYGGMAPSPPHLLYGAFEGFAIDPQFNGPADVFHGKRVHVHYRMGQGSIDVGIGIFSVKPDGFIVVLDGPTWLAKLDVGVAPASIGFRGWAMLEYAMPRE